MLVAVQAEISGINAEAYSLSNVKEIALIVIAELKT